MVLKIGGVEREARMRYLAIRKFRELTGKNLSGGKTTFFDIIGKDGETDPDLLVAFIFSVLYDGAHPAKPDFNVDDVASWLTIHDTALMGSLFELWMLDMTGKTKEELIEYYKEIEKNRQAPQSGASLSGTESSESLTAV
jgi:hypothetical protein